MLAIIPALLFLSSLQAPIPPVTLARTGQARQKLAYQVNSHIQVDARGGALLTWLPESFDYNYSFTTQITELKPGGMMSIHYLRPTLTEVKGETADSGPQEREIKENFNLQLTVSPLNEIINLKDLNAGEKKVAVHLLVHNCAPSAQVQSLMQQFVGEIYSLALNAGSFDSALDFAPKLPLDSVKPGDTWKHTVGYTPQKLKGNSANQVAVQRMDYVYTFQGVVDGEGKKVYRVTADLNLSTDLAEFFHQSVGSTSAETGIKSIPLNLKTHIDFDLDMNTRDTLKAVSSSEGGFSAFLAEKPEDAVHEERFKGHTTMRLTGRA